MTRSVADQLQAALADRYRLDGCLGTGGMAIVLRALDLRHSRPVAIKVLKPELAGGLVRHRFHREITLAARLQHPMVVPVFDSGETGSLLWYAMPLVEGISLRERLRQARGPLPLEETLRLLRDAASALDYAHAHGVIHRDVKPENILLTGGRAVVADFGIARVLLPGVDEEPLTPAAGSAIGGLGVAVGTPAYMSPEQAMGGAGVDGRTDIYALACVAFECLAGEPAFSGPTVPAVLAASVAGPRPRLARRRPDLPPALDPVLVRALAPEPADRPATAEAFVAELERAAQVHLSPVQVPALSARRPSHRRAGLAAALLAVLGLGGAWWAGRPAAPVAPGAQVIAVLPFQITVPGLEELQAGMVDLLARNLNDQGGIRTIDPPQVFAKWRQDAVVPDHATALALARELQAGSALTGSVVAAGATVRLSAALHATDGTELAQVQVTGAADSVLALVDTLTLRLLRAVWRSHEPLPSVRVAALTTSSLGALRDYLRGEAFYRRSQWDSAAVRYARALEQDSSFALALFRRTLVAGWTGEAIGRPERRQLARRAELAAGRLSPRERSLFTAFRLFDEGELAAVDSARRYVARWPDDPEGWYLLGEAQYHARAVTALSPAELRAPFDRVLAIDSTLAPAAIHPAQLALQDRDSTGFARYVRLLRQAGATARAEAYGTIWQAAWGPARGAAGDSAMALALRDDAFLSLLVGRLHDVAVDPDALLARLARAERAVRADAGLRTGLLTARAAMTAGLGRTTAADRQLDTLRLLDERLAARVAAHRTVLGLATAERVAGLLADGEATAADPWSRSLFISAALARGALPKARALLDAAATSDSVRASAAWQAVLAAQRGWLQMAQGDTAAGLAAIERALAQGGGLAASRAGAPVRFVQALVLASRPASREEGIRRLRWGFEQEPDYLPLAYEALGRALEAKGDTTGALDAYGRFARLWAGADAGLQPRVELARRAMADLTAEPRGLPPS